MKALVRNDGARVRRAAVELGPFGIRANTINASITPSFAVPVARGRPRASSTSSSAPGRYRLVDQALFGGSTLRALRTAHLHDTKTVADSRTFTEPTVLWIE